MAAHAFPGIGLVGGRSPGEDGWGDEMNGNLLKVSSLLHLTAISMTSVLPASPSDGVLYIVRGDDGANPNKIAVRDEGVWTYISPLVGMRARILDTSSWAWFNGSSWVAETLSGTFAGLSDVDVTTSPPADGDVATWSASESKWVPSPPSGGGVSNLGDLSDVSTSGASDGDVLGFSGGEWHPVDQAAGLPAVAGNAGKVLEVNGTGDAAQWATKVYDLSMFIPGTPAVSVEIVRLVAGRAYTLPSGLTGSVANAKTAPGASTAFTIKKNGTGIGTFTFAGISNTATFSMASDSSFAVGDVLVIESPSNLNSIADVSVTFLGTR